MVSNARVANKRKSDRNRSAVYLHDGVPLSGRFSCSANNNNDCRTTNTFSLIAARQFGSMGDGKTLGWLSTNFISAFSVIRAARIVRIGRLSLWSDVDYLLRVVRAIQPIWYLVLRLWETSPVSLVRCFRPKTKVFNQIKALRESFQILENWRPIAISRKFRLLSPRISNNKRLKWFKLSAISHRFCGIVLKVLEVFESEGKSPSVEGYGKTLLLFGCFVVSSLRKLTVRKSCKLHFSQSNPVHCNNLAQTVRRVPSRKALKSFAHKIKVNFFWKFLHADVQSARGSFSLRRRFAIALIDHVHSTIEQ